MSGFHIIIKGKVQGVFFRASAKEKAEGLGIQGWVRNTAEGNVEIKARGEEGVLQKFLDWCRNGPEKAMVTSVEQINSSDDESFNDFRILR
jgi:acylphosphatase